MTEYRVSWTVDIDAGDPIEAAIAAFNMMQQPRDPNDPDAAVVFGVWRSFDADPMMADTIDLADLDGGLLEFEDGEWRQSWKLLECDTCGTYGNADDAIDVGDDCPHDSCDGTIIRRKGYVA